VHWQGSFGGLRYAELTVRVIRYRGREGEVSGGYILLE